MAPHSNTLAWRIPWTQEPGRVQSMGSLRVGHDWATSLSLFILMHWRRKWQPTPVLLPGESHGRRSLVGCRLRGRTESDMTEATKQQQQQSFPGWYEIWLRLWVSHIWCMTRGNGFLLVASLTFIPQPKWWTLNSCSLTNVYPKEEDLDSNQRNDWPLLRQRLWLLSKKVAQFQINWISTLPGQTSYPYALLEKKESHLLPSFWSTFCNSLVQKVSALGSAAGRSNYITLPDPGLKLLCFFEDMINLVKTHPPQLSNGLIDINLEEELLYHQFYFLPGRLPPW